jgi:predicted DNA binding CopG/RHH family protein
MNNKIPDFKTYEEEAEFWDTHDTMDYADEFKPVVVQIRRKLDKVLPIRFDTHTVNELEKEAATKGVGATTLVRMWILERLNENGHSKPLM